MSTQGHNSVSHAWLRALTKIGYVGQVYEVPLGVSVKNKRIYGDGMAKNFSISATVLVWDVRVSSSYLVNCREEATQDMFVVTDYNEELKERSKGDPCRKTYAGRARFLPVVCNTHGGLGRKAWTWLTEAFQQKIDMAADSTAKHIARLEFQTLVAEISCAVLRRNSMMLEANAWPKAGNSAPPLDMMFADLRRDDVMQDAT